MGGAAAGAIRGTRHTQTRYQTRARPDGRVISNFLSSFLRPGWEKEKPPAGPLVPRGHEHDRIECTQARVEGWRGGSDRLHALGAVRRVGLEVACVLSSSSAALLPTPCGPGETSSRCAGPIAAAHGGVAPTGRRTAHGSGPDRPRRRIGAGMWDAGRGLRGEETLSALCALRSVCCVSFGGGPAPPTARPITPRSRPTPRPHWRQAESVRRREQRRRSAGEQTRWMHGQCEMDGMRPGGRGRGRGRVREGGRAGEERRLRDRGWSRDGTLYGL